MDCFVATLLAMTGLSAGLRCKDLPRRPHPRIMRPVRGREEIRRGGFAREEQAAVDRSGKHGALAGMAGEGMGVGAAGEGVVGPARFLQWLELAAEVVAEKGRDLVDRMRGDRAVAGVLQRLRKAPAEKTFDAGLAERTQMIRSHFG